MRRIGLHLLDHAHHLGQLVHQISLVVQAAGGVDQDDIGPLLLGGLDRLEGQRGGIRPLLPRHEGRAGPLRPDLQLLDRGRAEGVARRHQHAVPGVGKVLAELADGRGLTRPVDPDHKDDVGGVAGVDLQRDFDRQQHLGDLLRQRLANFLVGDFLVEAGLGEVGDDLRSRGCAEVGHDQRLFEFFEGIVVEFAPVEGADDTAGQPRRRLCQPAGQPREP